MKKQTLLLLVDVSYNFIIRVMGFISTTLKREWKKPIT